MNKFENQAPRSDRTERPEENAELVEAKEVLAREAGLDAKSLLQIIGSTRLLKYFRVLAASLGLFLSTEALSQEKEKAPESPDGQEQADFETQEFMAKLQSALDQLRERGLLTVDQGGEGDATVGDYEVSVFDRNKDNRISAGERVNISYEDVQTGIKYSIGTTRFRGACNVARSDESQPEFAPMIVKEFSAKTGIILTGKNMDDTIYVKFLSVSEAQQVVDGLLDAAAQPEQ